MTSKKPEKNVVVPKTTADLQKLKLDKLMKNPTKEVIIPERSKEWQPKGPQEFIRNVWGSSAGAGSGDFHVYRGIRRREYARQKFLDIKTAKDDADIQYKKKVLENQKAAEERTAKKRAKRLKKKQKMKEAKKQKVHGKKQETESEDESDENSAGEEAGGDDQSNTRKSNDCDVTESDLPRSDEVTGSCVPQSGDVTERGPSSQNNENNSRTPTTPDGNS